MAGRCGTEDSPVGFLSDAGGWPQDQPGTPWSINDGTHPAANAQVSQLVRALEFEVIPRLARSHRQPLPGQALVVTVLNAADIESFTACLIDDSEAGISRAVDAFRHRGISVESLFEDLFAGAARRLGEMWDDDRCDFCTVTVGLGRLQRLLRELSPSFGAEVDHPVNGRRAMLSQPPDEQHSFGLSMVAEFFRRAGWEIHGGPGGSATDPAARVKAEWFDMVGFSIGSEQRLHWLKSAIADVRRASRNAHIVVMVGGPLFALHPEWVTSVNADGTAKDARQAPTLAETMIASFVVAKRS